MNPPDPKLDRLLEAAQNACPPIPQPPPWFEQRMIQSLRRDMIPLAGPVNEDRYEDRFIFRILGGAALLMAISIILPLVQIKNPYLETMQWVQAVQMEKIREQTQS
jgi:hypothetical protein